MTQKAGRNDPCPCGSGKKYKSCCMKNDLPQGKKKFKASIMPKGTSSPSQSKDLMERTFGAAIASSNKPFVAKKKDKNDSEHFTM